MKPIDFRNRCVEQLAAEPLHRNQEHADWKQERREAAELKEEVGHVGSDRADPVACGSSAGRRRGNVERSIVRRIGEQAECEQDGEAEADEADQLVEAFVFSRCKDSHDDFPFFPVGATSLASGRIIRPSA